MEWTQEKLNMEDAKRFGVVLYRCPTCGAKQDEPCRTPKGRKKNNVHDTRPFGIYFKENEHEYANGNKA